MLCNPCCEVCVLGGAEGRGGGPPLQGQAEMMAEELTLTPHILRVGERAGEGLLSPRSPSGTPCPPSQVWPWDRGPLGLTCLLARLWGAGEVRASASWLCACPPPPHNGFVYPGT